jgi:polyhydroxyalkanoic acid synthase PhaR subunit
MELWKQWYETSSRMWSNVMQGSRESYVDPYGLYRQWFNGMEETRGRLQEASEEMMPPAGHMPGADGVPQVDMKGAQENFQRMVDMNVDAYRKATEATRGMFEMLPQWAQVVEESRENLMKGEGFATDPLSFGVQWYNATSGPLSKFTEDLLHKDEFLGPASRFLDSYTTFYKVLRRNSEEYLSNLQLPTRSDISRVASLVIALEDKVDRIEDAFEDFEYGYAEPASAESLQSLDDRVQRVEGKLDQLLSAVEALSSNNSSGDSQGEVQASNGSQSSQPANREPDSQPTVDQPTASQEEEQVKATEAARRKAGELGVELGEVQGTGVGGQITVEDVRKKGES